MISYNGITKQCQDLDVLWTKENLRRILYKFQSTLSHREQQASGDGVVGRCCRLCGGEAGLRPLAQAYIWEGAEESFDQLLNDCFGINITSPDSMVCDSCIQQLHNTRRFKALVLAAFEPPLSEHSSSRTFQLSKFFIKTKPRKDKVKFVIPEKSHIEMTKPKTYFQSKFSREIINNQLNRNTKAKRVNIACKICKQKYPMLIAGSTDTADFVCSRCKKNKKPKTGVCKRNNVTEDHIEQYAKTSSRRKNRLCYVVREASPFKPSLSQIRNSLPRKYNKQFPKKYAFPMNFTEHVGYVHGRTTFGRTIGGKELKTKETLDRHLQRHTGDMLNQCISCRRPNKRKTNMYSVCKKHV